MKFQEKIKSHSADLLLDICPSQKGSCSEVSQAVRFSICPRHSSLHTWPYNKPLITGISNPFPFEYLGLAAPARKAEKSHMQMVQGKGGPIRRGFTECGQPRA